MAFLINLLLAALAAVLAHYLCLELGAPRIVRIIVVVLVAIAVFFANAAAYVLR